MAGTVGAVLKRKRGEFVPADMPLNSMAIFNFFSLTCQSYSLAKGGAPEKNRTGPRPAHLLIFLTSFGKEGICLPLKFGQGRR
ncbi:hypothetical protein ACUUL3_06340 [Thiovibrio sp. JS02]